MEFIEGNIVDIAPALGTWFIIFADGSEPMNGFTTKDDAIKYLMNRIK